MFTSSFSIFLFISTVTFSTTLSSTTLLSLNCTQPPPPISINTGSSLARLLDRLIDHTKTAHFAISSVTVNRINITGLVQCKSDLDRTQCNVCVRFAKRTLLTLCPNPVSVMTWLDGCYVEASLQVGSPPRSTLTSSCSDKYPVPWVSFDSAFTTLLLSLRTGLHRDQFYYSNTTSDSGQKIHGYIECIRTLSTSECRSCVEEALQKLDKDCRGRAGGYVVLGRCIVRFKALGFITSTLNMSTSSPQEEREGGNRVERLVLMCWGVVVACLAGFVWTVWLILRNIVNHAKVAVIDATMEEDTSKL